MSYTNPSNLSYSIEFSMCVLLLFFLFFSFLVLECILGFVIFGLCKRRSKACSWVKCICIFFLVFCVLEKVRVIVYHGIDNIDNLESSDYWSLLFSHCYFFFLLESMVSSNQDVNEGLRSFVAFCGVIFIFVLKNMNFGRELMLGLKSLVTYCETWQRTFKRGWDTKWEMAIKPNNAWLQKKTLINSYLTT